MPPQYKNTQSCSSWWMQHKGRRHEIFIYFLQESGLLFELSLVFTEGVFKGNFLPSIWILWFLLSTIMTPRLVLTHLLYNVRRLRPELPNQSLHASPRFPQLDFELVAEDLDGFWRQFLRRRETTTIRTSYPFQHAPQFRVCANGDCEHAFCGRKLWISRQKVLTASATIPTLISQ